MSELESDPDIMKFTPRRVPQTLAQTEARLQALLAKPEEKFPLGVWAAELKDSGDFVGWFMLIPTTGPAYELGYMLVKRNWGRGFAVEASRALMSCAQRLLDARQFTASTDPENLASIRVLEKLGFQYSKTIRKPDPVLGREVELKVFEYSALI